MPGEAWSDDEDIMLCTAFVNVSEDGAVGTDQSSAKLWQRVFDKFKELCDAKKVSLKRDKAATLQNRWASRIKPDVGLFANILTQVWILCWLPLP